MKKYFLTIINLMLTISIFIGLPYIAGNWGLICLSWIPALFVLVLMEDEIDQVK